MNHTYHSVNPQNEKSSYSENDQISFMLDFPGRKLIPGSVRFEANYSILDSGNNITTNLIYLDPQCGAHSFIESVTTEMAQKGIVEVINSDYARYVKSKVQATHARMDMLSSSKISELCSADQRSSSSKLRFKVNINDTNAQNVINDFSLKLENCLNNIEGGNLSYNQSGYCKVDVNLARHAQAFYGPAHTENISFTLTNVRMKFQSVPEDNQNSQLVMNTIYNIKQGISSSSANISSKVPSVCKGFVGSFGKTSSANTVAKNGNKTEQPPSMQEIRVMFNNASNQLLTYSLRNVNDQMIKAKQAFGNDENGPSQMSPSDRQAELGGYMFGASFDQLVNLTNQKINVQFDSGITNSEQYTCHIFFMGVVSL